MANPGSSGNVLAAICSFFIPGLGQLVQGRVLAAIIFFVLCGVLYFSVILWIVGACVHLWAIIDAAKYRSLAGLLS